MIINADLHIHSHFSKTANEDMNIKRISLEAPKKGLNLVATGDCLNSRWLQEIKKCNYIDEGTFELNHTRFILNTIARKDTSVELLKDLDQRKYIKIASHNRILYLFVKNLLNLEGVSRFPELEKNLKEIINKGDEYLDKLKQTIAFVLEILSQAKIQFLITKNCRTELIL